MLYGADLASFQGAPGQWREAAGPIRWAAVKLTELQPDGTRYVNPDAVADWAYLQEQGLGRIAYLFGHPAVSAGDTVVFFADQAWILGLADGDGIMLDLEVTDGLAPAEVSAWAAQVMTALAERFSRVPVLYTYLSFAEAGNCASLGRYPLWISDPSSPEGQPRVPAPWKAWVIHQFSTSAPVDRDVAAYPDLSRMREALGKAEEWEDYVTPGGVSLRRIAEAGHTYVPTVLELTAQAFGRQGAIFDYIAAADWDAPMNSGIRLRVPAGTRVTPQHRRRAVRSTALAVAGTARAAVSGTRSFTRTEPVMASGAVLAVLAAVLGWALPHLGVHWDHAVNSGVLTGLAALSGLWAALRVTRPSVAGVTAAVQALAAASATFGLRLPTADLAMASPVIALVVALLLRGHVSPRTAAGPPAR